MTLERLTFVNPANTHIRSDETTFQIFEAHLQKTLLYFAARNIFIQIDQTAKLYLLSTANNSMDVHSIHRIVDRHITDRFKDLLRSSLSRTGNEAYRPTITLDDII